MRKDVLYIIVAAVGLIIVGTVGIVLLGAEDSTFADLNLSTGFGLFTDEIFGLPLGWVVSAVLLVVALILFYLFVWRKR